VRSCAGSGATVCRTERTTDRQISLHPLRRSDPTPKTPVDHGLRILPEDRRDLIRRPGHPACQIDLDSGQALGDCDVFPFPRELRFPTPWVGLDSLIRARWPASSFSFGRWPTPRSLPQCRHQPCQRCGETGGCRTSVPRSSLSWCGGTEITRTSRRGVGCRCHQVVVCWRQCGVWRSPAVRSRRRPSSRRLPRADSWGEVAVSPGQEDGVDVAVGDGG
jgi:hypothetical protein